MRLLSPTSKIVAMCGAARARCGVRFRHEALAPSAFGPACDCQHLHGDIASRRRLPCGRLRRLLLLLNPRGDRQRQSVAFDYRSQIPQSEASQEEPAPERWHASLLHDNVGGSRRLRLTPAAAAAPPRRRGAPHRRWCLMRCALERGAGRCDPPARAGEDGRAASAPGRSPSRGSTRRR